MGYGKYKWTDEKIRYIREHYPYEPLTDVSDAVGASPSTVKKKVDELGIVKAKDYDPKKYLFRYVKKYKNERYEHFKED